MMQKNEGGGSPRVNVAYSVPFRLPASSIVGLGLGLVVGLGTVLVLFFFLHFLLSDVC